MKVAVVTRFIHRAGGVETYLESVLPALTRRGHEVTVWYEYAAAIGTTRIVPDTIPSHEIGAGGAVASIPKNVDVIFLHGLSEPALEDNLQSIAPLVVFLHAYNGTCVSETKSYAFPRPAVCSRSLGVGCLVRYFPRRCGGLNPFTMMTSYSRQRDRRHLLRGSDAVATLSAHMRAECIAQGVDAARVSHLPAFVQAAASTEPDARHDDSGGACAVEERLAAEAADGRLTHMVFAGRMERLKGGHVLIDALHGVSSSHRKKMRITFAGDGRERERWEMRATRVAHLDVRFVGWLSPSARSTLFRAADVLVVPSIWPEPLGLVGLEAAAEGTPAVAFDVGGIREWLTDGVTGRLVPAGNTRALTAALEECIEAPHLVSAWARAALVESRRRTLQAHVDALEDLLTRAARSTRINPQPPAMSLGSDVG
jgi:glycosyltransferase involved in cell wall biosynthesis